MAIKVASRNNCNLGEIIAEIDQPNVQAVYYFFSPCYEEQQPQMAFTRAFPQAL